MQEKPAPTTSPEADEPEEHSPNSFLKVLADIEAGDFAAEASEELAELVKLVRNRYGKGSITVKLDLEPKGNQIIIKPDITVKVPKVERAPSIKFSDDHGNLLKDSPDQKQFEFGRPEIAE